MYFDFKPYLKYMHLGYNKKKLSMGNKVWYRSRTDDVLYVRTNGKVLLVCVGTEPKWREWFWNIAFVSVEWLNIGRVHGGFARNVHELLGREDQGSSLITVCNEANERGDSIDIIGHSRGFPIAALMATQLINHGIPASRITVVGCGGARLGCKRFKRSYQRLLGERTYVLNGKRDPIRFLPPWGNTNGRVQLLDMTGHGIEKYMEVYEKFRQ